MIPTPADPFEEWFRLPVEALPDDSPYEVRRARPEEFPRLYDVVDRAFGVKRPRDLFDWLYLRNPFGIARCWIVVERKTGDVLKTGAAYPWPVWRGSEPLLGSLGGDAATLPDWQRRGLSRVRNQVRNTHPWYARFCGIAGPNEGSRAVMRKQGRGANVLGRLRGLGLGPALEAAWHSLRMITFVRHFRMFPRERSSAYIPSRRVRAPAVRRSPSRGPSRRRSRCR